MFDTAFSTVLQTFRTFARPKRPKQAPKAPSNLASDQNPDNHKTNNPVPSLVIA